MRLYLPVKQRYIFTNVNEIWIRCKSELCPVASLYQIENKSPETLDFTRVSGLRELFPLSPQKKNLNSFLFFVL